MEHKKTSQIASFLSKAMATKPAPADKLVSGAAATVKIPADQFRISNNAATTGYLLATKWQPVISEARLAQGAFYDEARNAIVIATEDGGTTLIENFEAEQAKEAELLARIEVANRVIERQDANWSLHNFETVAFCHDEREARITKFFAAAALAAKQVLNPVKPKLIETADEETSQEPVVPANNVSAPAQTASEPDITLKILKDAEGTKLAQRLFTDYVSDVDMSKLLQFFLAFDSLLFKFRDGKPLEKPEADELDDVQEKRVSAKAKKAKKGKVKKKEAAPEEPATDEEPSDIEEVEVAALTETAAQMQFTEFFRRWLDLADSNELPLMMLSRAAANQIDNTQGRDFPGIFKFFGDLIGPQSSWSHTFTPIGLINGALLLTNSKGASVRLVLALMNNAKKPMFVTSQGNNVILKKVQPNAPRAFFDLLVRLETMTRVDAENYLENFKG